MSKLFFCGDPHGEFSHIIEAATSRRPDAVILLGDMECTTPLQEELALILDFTQVYWIPGNHDTGSEKHYDNLFGSTLADRNLHGRIVDIAGVKIAGLGGVFRGQIWNPQQVQAPRFSSAEDYLYRVGRGNRWRDGLTLKHRSTIFPDVYAKILTLGKHIDGADILVTHEAPHMHEFGFKAITDLAIGLSLKTDRRLKSFHGHLHETMDYLPHSQLEGHAVGFRAIVELDIQSWQVTTIKIESLV